MAAGPASRLGSTEPGDKTGPRPSPALALAQSPRRPYLFTGGEYPTYSRTRAMGDRRLRPERGRMAGYMGSTLRPRPKRWYY